MTTATTLPKLMRRNAATMAARPAIREKRQGIWKTFTWAQYSSQVEQFARGLAAQGFRRGDRLAVLGDNRPRLYWALLAAQALGGVAVPAWPDADSEWLADILRATAISVAVVEDQDQAEKLLSVGAALPDLRMVVSLGPNDEWPLDRQLLCSFDAVVEAGRQSTIDIAAEVERGEPGDPALICFTTQADGPPRGVLLSHASLIGAAEALIAAADFRPTDDCLSFLPMAWIGDALYSTTLGLLVGFTCNCPEDPETARRDLRELGPTILVAPPRVWESLLTEADIKAAQATPLKRQLFAHFRRLAGSETSSAPRRLLGDILIYAATRDQLGLGRTRWAHIGGGTLAPNLSRLLRGFGVNLKQTYGPAALSGIVAVQGSQSTADGAAVRPCPGIEIRIAPDGEVQARSPGMCLGYFGDEDATRAALTGDGWWRTGDSGRVDARGHLIVTGRMADLGRLADSVDFAPDQIEIALRGSRFVADAVVPGDDCPLVAAMIVADATAVGDWARARGIVYTTFAELIAAPAVRQLFQDEIRARNASLPRPLQVRRFALLDGGTAAGTEAGLSREFQRRALLRANAALATALFRRHDQTGDAAWLIDDIDEDGRIAREPAHV